MEVRTRREHGNAHPNPSAAADGRDQYLKRPRDIYDLPQPQADQLIADELVAPVQRGANGRFASVESPAQE